MLTRKEIEKIRDCKGDGWAGEYYGDWVLGLCETALALYDRFDLANEEIRHAYSDNETHRRRISELETENERLKEMVCSPIDFAKWKKDIEVKGESLMKQYIDATYRAKELEAEIERLKREQLEWSREALEHAKELEAENCQLEQYRRWYDEETAPLRAENARLKECMKDMFSMEDMDAAQFEVNRLTIENARLRGEAITAQRTINGLTNTLSILDDESVALREVVEAAKEIVRRHRSTDPYEYLRLNIEQLEAALERLEGK